MQSAFFRLPVNALKYDLTQDKLDLFLSAVKDGLCPAAYHTCQRDFKNPGEYYCREDALCDSDKPHACYVRNEGEVTKVCVDLSNDREHCGECGHTCGDNESCRDGVCDIGCPRGFVLCKEQCINLRAYHLKNCSACGESMTNCTSFSAYCNAGTCKCVADTHSICSNKCVNLNNCGKCGVKCTSAQTCTNGACKAK